ncbi:MAG: UDP-N-acetylmuramoyl-L-alanyl-D-glutamate--2,6-diaminopimelate ligase [Gammaproteobacteria bacterium]|nr:UDP-N-acetylmuramoyl-L-alanyl-D-glutamate--2,6-diaminopimelate ligase [Gammaproteobacteria bacterium]
MRLSELVAELGHLGATPELRWNGLDVDVSGMSVDTRALRRGDAFIALNGSQAHGLEHLQVAIDAGASAVFWEPDEDADWAAYVAARCRWIPAVRVPALRAHLGEFAARYYGSPSDRVPVVAATGTDGKTSVTQIIARAMSLIGDRFGVLGTIGNGFPGELKATPNTTMDVVGVQSALAELVTAGASGVALEASSHGLDQGRLDGVHLRGAVLTNLSRDHLDYHGDVAAYAAAKRRLFLFPNLEFVILNSDDHFGRDLLADAAITARKISYGTAPDADVRIEEVAPRQDGLRVRLAGRLGGGVIASRLMGDFNAANLAAAFAVMRELGVDADAVLSALSRVSPIEGRMEAWHLPADVTVVVDYAHTPAALEHALRTLRSHAIGKLHCVFGCGGDRDQGKRPLMGAAAERLADYTVVTDDNPRNEDPDRIIAQIVAGMQRPEAAAVIRDREAAIRRTIAGAAPGDIVLVAGKGHEDYQIVGARRTWFSDRALVGQIQSEKNREAAR